MTRLHPGWLVALFAVVLSVGVWLPWLTTSANGGGRASAIGGRVGELPLRPGFGAGQLIALAAVTLLVLGAMVARGLAAAATSTVAVLVSVLIVGLIVVYYRQNVAGPVESGYGLYVGVVGAGGALLCAVWALIDSLLGQRRG